MWKYNEVQKSAKILSLQLNVFPKVNTYVIQYAINQYEKKPHRALEILFVPFASSFHLLLNPHPGLPLSWMNISDTAESVGTKGDPFFT